ncbi:MAG TPA: M50 family metallopeptidase [Kofleriaceae bacterium]|nr:M50 family metallopeptidase [Kofleriaceae bacterium]
MFRSFRLGTLFGFPIHVNVTFLILLGVVGLTMGGVGAIAVVLLSFGSVVLHELGHALVARHLGVRIDRIELHFFGGAAQMTDHPRSAGDEIAIAAAGPAVSFALAGVSLLLAQLSGLVLFHQLAWINLILGAFNLVPALPMDGGRILRAVLSRRMGYARATETSVVIARYFAIALGVLGIATLHFYLALLAVLLWMMSTGELRAVRNGLRDYPGAYAAYRDAADADDRFAGPAWSWRQQPPRAPAGFSIRRDGNRVIIERLD